MGTCDFPEPEIYARARGHSPNATAYISDKLQVPMLQLLHTVYPSFIKLCYAKEYVIEFWKITIICDRACENRACGHKLHPITLQVISQCWKHIFPFCNLHHDAN